MKQITGKTGFYIFCVVVFLFSSTSFLHAEIVKLSSLKGQELSGTGTRYIEDVDKKHSFEFVRSSMADSLWMEQKKENISFGYTDSAYWIKISVKNDTNDNGTYFFEIGYPVLDYIDVYVQNDQGQTTIFKMGDKQHFVKRPVQHRHFIAPVEMNAGEILTIFVRVQSSSAVQLPLYMYEENLFIGSEGKYSVGLGFYYGAMIIMILYNFFIFVLVRKKHLLYYVLYVICMLIFVASLNGISFQFLWPESIWWNDQVLLMSLGALAVFVSLLTIDLLKLPESRPRFCMFLRALIVFQCFNMLISFKVSYRISILLIIGTSVIGIITSLYIGIRRLLDGYSPARFYVLAFTSMYCAGFVLAMNKFNVLPVNLFTENAMNFGSIIEVILLSFAMADRINNDKREKNKALENAYIQETKARIANENLLENQRKTAERLEVEVKERTNELKINLEKEKLAGKEIANGLTYARMIQLSILPTVEDIEAWFNDFFLIWDPRDIVGGDFYYIDKVDGYYVIVIADCTGHGVPGAFLTMIASTELKKIVRVEKCFKPSEILNRLNVGMKEILKQDSNQGFSDEGVDLAVCVINPSKELIFAGAKQNLYFTKNNEIFTIKGDKISIGYVKTKTEIEFTEHSVKLENGMKFYIPTDGVADQVSGETRRRFGTGKLKDFFLENKDEPLENQPGRLLKLLENHRSGRSVVDDVTLFAFSSDLNNSDNSVIHINDI